VTAHRAEHQQPPFGDRRSVVGANRV